MTDGEWPVSKFARLTTHEVWAARREFPPFHSTHGGFAVLKEEVDELWDCVRQKDRGDTDAMLKECIQIAAMATCFAAELCDDALERK